MSSVSVSTSGVRNGIVGFVFQMKEMQMIKLQKLLKAARATSDAIGVLEASGVNVDKIVGISNAQGPHARVLQSTISSLAEALADLTGHSVNGTDKELVDASRLLSAPTPPKKKTPKAKRGRGSSASSQRKDNV
jgi:hypothetical protein